MALIRDDRQKLDGAAGMHVFLAGVSLYQHLDGGGGPKVSKDFGLRQLSSTAATAWLMYEWLLRAEREGRLPLPIATIHLLLSPSAGELARLPAMGQSGADRCSRANFVRDAFSWRDCASRNNEDMTLFYFAGHGVQRRQKDAVLLLDDFGAPMQPSLFNAVEVHELIGGMAPMKASFGIVAQQQVYFVDACRMPAAEFHAGEWKKVAPLWDIDETAPDGRNMPVFYATIEGTSAFAVRGEQTLFSMALLECLDRFGADAPSTDDEDERWRVTSWLLVQRLRLAIDKINAEKGGDQEFAHDGQTTSPIILSYLNERPEVDVLLTLDPAEAANAFQVDIEDEHGAALQPITRIDPHPHSFRLRAGTYGFTGRTTAPVFRPFRRLTPVSLPRFLLKEKVK